MTLPTFQKGDMRALLGRFLRTGQTAVDVGAAVGELSVVMANYVGLSGAVYAYEPTIKSAGTFAKGCTSPVIVLNRLALGERIGECVLYRHASLEASRWHGDDTEPVTVPMTTLDAQFPTQTVDLVKIDAQGSEGHILDGAVELLKRCPVWILEWWPWGLRTAGRSCQSVIDQLRNAGLRPHWIDCTPIDDASVAEFDSPDRRRSSHANIYAIR